MVRLYLLRPTRCESPDGTELTSLTRSPKRLALLSYLACASPGFHRRDTLLGLFWPESDDRHARSALRQTLLQLRSDLGEAVRSRGREEVGVDRDVFWCDARAFEDSLPADPESSLELYDRGLLEGFHLSGAPEFQRWLEENRRRLRRLASEAAQSLSVTDQSDKAVHWARRALDLTPYDEKVAQRLFQTLSDRGDRAGALREFDRFTQRLQEDLGVAPSSETQSVIDVLRGGAGAEQARPASGSLGTESLAREMNHEGVDTTAGHRVPRSTGANAPTRLRSLPRSAWAIALSLVMVGTLGAAWFVRTTPPTSRSGSLVQLTNGPGNETNPAISPDGRWVAYSGGSRTRTDIYQREIGADPIILTRDLPGSHHHPTWSPDGKQLAFVTDMNNRSRVQVMILGGTARTVRETEEDLLVRGVAWSPDGARIAHTAGSTLYVTTLATGSTVALVQSLEPNSPAWSPDGRWIAFVEGNYDPGTNAAPASIWLVSSLRGQARQIVGGGATNANPMWARNSDALWFVSDRAGTLDVYRIGLDAGGIPSADVERMTSGASVTDASLSADGTRLVFSMLIQSASVWRVPIPESGVSVDAGDGRRVTGGDAYTETLRVSPGKGLLGFDANEDGSHDLFVMEMGRGGSGRRITNRAGHAFAPSFSPTGDRIVYYAYEGDEGRHLHIADLDRGTETRLTRGSARDAFPDWSPIGDQIVFQRRLPNTDGPSLFVTKRSETDGTWGEPTRLWTQSGAEPRWSPDGAWIAFETYHDVRVISEDGADVRILSIGATNPVWARDGKTVFVKYEEEPDPSLWAVPMDGGTPRLVMTDTASLTSGIYDADARHLYYIVLERDTDLWIQSFNTPSPNGGS